MRIENNIEFTKLWKPLILGSETSYFHIHSQINEIWEGLVILQNVALNIDFRKKEEKH